MKSEEGQVQITYIDEQWIVQVDDQISIIENLGKYNSKITAFYTIKSMDSLKTYLKDLSLLKNIVN
jgi:hypothetical protein